MKQKIFLLLVIYFLLNTFLTQAQTFVSGFVMDQNEKPVPFANILFENSSVGTTSSENGYFEIESEKNYSNIVVSLIGYQTAIVPLRKGNTKNLKITLIEGEVLREVTVVSKPKKRLKKEENPAYKILQNIWKNKSKNSSYTPYYSERNTLTQVGVTHIDTAYSKYLFGKEAKIIQNQLNESHNASYNIPMLMIYKKEIKNKDNVYEIVKDSSIGITNKNFEFDRIRKTIKNFNIYDNSLLVLNKPFVSPISEYGYRSYLYVLSDTLFENNQKIYKIHFFPKIDEDIAFEGFFTVYDSIFAIQQVQMHTNAKANINLVKNLFFKKEFEKINNQIVLKKDDYDVEFAMSDEENSSGFYLKNQIVYSNTLKGENSNSSSLKSIFGSKIENTQNLIGIIEKNKNMNLITNAISAMVSGFIDINRYFQFGSFWETLRRNDVEGFKVKVGFRSFFSTEDRFRTYFYGSFSENKSAFKYGVSAMYLLSKNPRVILGASYQDDFIQQGTPSQYPEISILKMREKIYSLLSRGNNFFITETKKTTGVLDFALEENLHLAVVATQQKIRSANEKYFSIAYKKNDITCNDLTDFSTAVSFIYTPKRNVYGNGVEQRYGQNLHSSFEISYIQGFKGVMNSDFSYTKLQGRMRVFFPVFEFGLLKTYFEAGKIFHPAPISLLYPIASNQTYSNAPGVFALLDYYDLITSEYVAGHFEHHFNGYIINKIPLVKKSQFRIVTLARFAYGNISQSNIDINRSNLHYKAPTKPYWEYGIGIENIGYQDVRPIRIDFIWRNSFEDINGISSPKFGIRMGIYPEF